MAARTSHEPQHSTRRSMFALTITRHWLLVFIVLFGIFVTLPFLAPIAMKINFVSGANAIYTAYSALCHQMAQRSFFLFGPEVMNNIDQLPVELVGSPGGDMLLLRQFRGGVDIGWKIAWSDRMVYMYGSIWVAAVVYWMRSRQRAVKPMPIWVFGLLMLPMVIDGTMHMLSDFWGLTGGFRYDNAWLSVITNSILPDSFYAGDAIGSFNSWMRLLSGVTFGTGIVWLLFPHIDQEMRRSTHILNTKNEQLDHLLREAKSK